MRTAVFVSCCDSTWVRNFRRINKEYKKGGFTMSSLDDEHFDISDRKDMCRECGRRRHTSRPTRTKVIYTKDAPRR